MEPLWFSKNLGSAEFYTEKTKKPWKITVIKHQELSAVENQIEIYKKNSLNQIHRRNTGLHSLIYCLTDFWRNWRGTINLGGKLLCGSRGTLTFHYWNHVKVDGYLHVNKCGQSLEVVPL
jgi:hypothetical protein